MARKRSVQELMGVRRFTKYGLFTDRGELIFYQVNPTNISVLSKANIETKITHLKMLLSSIPDIEITCTDSSECFDDNKVYLQERIAEESNFLMASRSRWQRQGSSSSLQGLRT